LSSTFLIHIYFQNLFTPAEKLDIEDAADLADKRIKDDGKPSGNTKIFKAENYRGSAGPYRQGLRDWRIQGLSDFVKNDLF